MMRMGSWAAVLLPALAASAVSTGAAAQGCESGRVASPATQGRCCWPAQTWSAANARCEGPPQCPAGMAGSGDTCVPSVASEPQTGLAAPLAPAPSTQTALSWPLVAADLGSGVVNPRVVRDDGDMPLIISGITLAGVGYLAGILTGVFDALSGGCYYGGCGSWPLGFVPVIGGVLAGTVSFSGYRNSVAWGFALGIPAAVTEAVGITLLLVGLFTRHEELVPSVEAGSARIHILPYATASSGGVSIDVEL